MKSTALLATVGVSALILVGCSDPNTGGPDAPEKDGQVVVGVTQPLSGPAAANGQRMVDAVNLAAEQINASTSLSCEVVVQAEDTEGTAEGGIAATRTLLDQAGATVLIGDYTSTVALAQKQLAVDAGIPIVLTTPSHPDATKDRDGMIFRIAMPNAVQQAQWIDIVTAQDFETLYFLAGRGAYEDTHIAAMNTDLLDRGLDVVGTETFEPTTTDFRSIISKVADADPDAVYLSVTSSAPQIVIYQEQATAGLDSAIRFANPTGVFPQTLLEAGQFMDGVITADVWYSGLESEASTSFVDAYVAKYSTDPSSIDAYGYAALRIIEEALAEIGTCDADGAAIADALGSVEYDGVMPVKFNPESGENEAIQLIPLVVEDAQLVLAE
jgi:branched-chain amino acid transport system substrate-binding protein